MRSAYAFGGAAYLFAVGGPACHIRSLSILDENGRLATIGAHQIEFLSWEHPPSHPGQRGLCFAIAAEALVSIDIFSRTQVEICLTPPSRTAPQVSAVEFSDATQMADAPLDIRRAIARARSPVTRAIFAGGPALRDEKLPIISAEAAAWVASTLVLELHLTGLPADDLVILSADGTAASSSQSHVAFAGDKQGVRSGTPVFAAVAPLSQDRSVELLLCRLTAGSLAPIARLELPSLTSPETMTARLWASAAGKIDRPFTLQKLLAHLLCGARRPARYSAKVQTISDPDSTTTPQISVIVPIFANTALLAEILAMQSRLSSCLYEMIIVCDDPARAHEVRDVVARQAGRIRHRTILVENSENYGYGAANNIGSLVATGDVLLLLNSDVSVHDDRAIATARSSIASGEMGVVGFRLLYPGGRLQHDGMTLVKHPPFGNLHVLDHPGKGTWPTRGTAEIVERIPATEFVTGAALLISRTLFENIGGFSPLFVRGDFEDAELCLRARSAGAEIGIVRTNSMFHEERQSIAKIERSWSLAAMTFHNCAVFNRFLHATNASHN